jgi:hypothetical protein
MDYQLGSLGKTCAASGKPLCPGDRCVSALVEQPGRLVRLDFLEAHWTGEPPQTVGTWRYQIPEATAQQQRILDTDTLFRFFEQLTEDANPGQERLRYVLSLFLLQRRRLKLEGSRQEGKHEYLVFHGQRGEGPYEVVDQQLAADEMAALQAELATRLQTDWGQAA